MLTSRLAVLPAWNGSSDLDFQTLLSGQDGCEGELRGRWRVVELVSQSGQPFEAQLAWTAGNGGNLTALVTVARAARVGLFARHLDVQVANLASAENVVSGVVAPAQTFVQTRNQYEVRGQEGPDATHMTAVEIPIPPFAERLHLYFTDNAGLSTWTVSVTDAQGTLRSETTADLLPPDGIYIGGAGTIAVNSNGNVGSWRAVFSLSL